MEAKSKGECIELVIDSLLKLEECCVEAVSWLERSKAFVPDESKAVQELKDALAKSIERETELENALALSEDSRDDLKSSLRKALQREGGLKGKQGEPPSARQPGALPPSAIPPMAIRPDTPVTQILAVLGAPK